MSARRGLYERGMDFFNSPAAQEITKPIEEKGLKALGYFSMGWRHIHSNIAVHKPEDLKGVKIRTEPAPTRMAIFSSMGANPIPMDFGEVMLENRGVPTARAPCITSGMHGLRSSCR